MGPIAFRRANLESQMSGGLRSLGGRHGRRKSRSALRSVAPLGSDRQSPGSVQRGGDFGHTRGEATRGCRGHCGI
jgi:hypothetical protein